MEAFLSTFNKDMVYSFDFVFMSLVCSLCCGLQNGDGDGDICRLYVSACSISRTDSKWSNHSHPISRWDDVSSLDSGLQSTKSY